MTKEIRPDHVAIYIRWSTEDQGDGTTLAVQTEACQHYLKSQGWQIRDEFVYIDDGYSGGSLDRPAIKKLRKAIQDGLIDCVVVFKLDRLSRSVIDTVTLVLQEWEDLTHLKSAREPVDTTSAMGKQFFYMLVSYAEWERNVIKERMFSGRLRRAKEGKYPGGPPPYGYRGSDAPGMLLIVEEQATVVRLVYDMAERGVSVRQITVHLNKSGFESRKGAPWGTSMVSKMLHNPIYTGRLLWGRRRVNPRYGKTPDERKIKWSVPHVTLDQSHTPAIIDSAQYDRVQKLMEGNLKIMPAAKGSDYLLTGILKCARCGRFMQHNGYEHWIYYRCGGKVQQSTCDAPSIPTVLLEETVVQHLRERYAPEVAGQAVLDRSQETSRYRQEQVNTLAAVTAGMGKIDAQERRLNQDYLQERITADDRRQLLTHIQEERGDLLAAESAARARLQQLESTVSLQQSKARLLRGASEWSALPIAEQKQILRYFVTEIRAERVEKAKVEIDVTWTDEPATLVAT